MKDAKYKVGDKLICLPDFTTSEGSGGAGYAEKRVFTVMRVSDCNYGVIYWPEEIKPNNNGIYERAVKLYIPDEVINTYTIY